MSGEQEVFGAEATAVEEQLLPSDAEDHSNDAGADQSDGFSEADLIALLDARVGTRLEQQMARELAKLYQGIQGLTDRAAAKQQQRIDVLEQKLAVAIQYAEEMSDPERVAALRAQQAQAERDRELAELKAERDALRERQNATPQERSEVEAEQADLQRWFNEEAGVRLQRYATNAGVSLSDPAIQSKWPKVMPTRADGRIDRVAFEDSIQALIDAAAEASERAAKVNRPRATPDNTRAAGGVRSNADLWDDFGAGKIGWSPAVQAAGKALGVL